MDIYYWMLYLSCKFSNKLMIFAINKKRIDIVRELIDKGVDVNVGDNDVPLTHAIRTRNVEMVKLLIDNGADVNYYDVRERNQLTLSLIYNNFQIIKMLVENGADVNANSKYDHSNIEIAIDIPNNQHTINLLFEYGIDKTDISEKLKNFHNLRRRWMNIEVLAQNGVDLKYLTKHISPATGEISASVMIPKMSFEEICRYLKKYKTTDKYFNEIKNTRWKFWKPFLLFMSRRNLETEIIGKMILSYLNVI